MICQRAVEVGDIRFISNRLIPGSQMSQISKAVKVNEWIREMLWEEGKEGRRKRRGCWLNTFERRGDGLWIHPWVQNGSDSDSWVRMWRVTAEKVAIWEKQLLNLIKQLKDLWLGYLWYLGWTTYSKVHIFQIAPWDYWWHKQICDTYHVTLYRQSRLFPLKLKSRCSLDHSHIMLENMIIRIYTNLSSSSSAVNKPKDEPNTKAFMLIFQFYFTLT